MSFLRWIFVPVVTAAVYGATWCGAVLLGELFLPVKGLLAGVTFFAAGLGVFAGALTAPKRRFLAAALLATVGEIGLYFSLGIDNWFAAILGGACGTGLVVLWFSPNRPESVETWVKRGLVVFGIGLIAMVMLYWWDFPSFQDPIPSEFQNHSEGISGCHTHIIPGGFLDCQILWRLDVAPEALSTITNRLALMPAPSIPSQFWDHTPYWWPHRLPAGAEVFQSEGFQADQRGADGNFYMLLYDRNHHRVFAWVKSNF